MKTGNNCQVCRSIGHLRDWEDFNLLLDAFVMDHGHRIYSCYYESKEHQGIVDWRKFKILMNLWYKNDFEWKNALINSWFSNLSLFKRFIRVNTQVNIISHFQGFSKARTFNVTDNLNTMKAEGPSKILAVSLKLFYRSETYKTTIILLLLKINFCSFLKVIQQTSIFVYF